MSPTLLWENLLRRLEKREPDWRARAGLDVPRPVTRSPGSGPPISDRQAFEAFTLALLSGNTRWERIEAIRASLGDRFSGFDPHAFAHVSDADIEQIVDWFRAQRAGSARLRDSLLRLRQTAAVLAGEEHHDSADEMIRAAFKEAGEASERIALLLGKDRKWKLPGFGIALAAEALRNLGFDLSKPDRHVLRAMGSWGLVRFARWDRKGPFTAPQARPAELVATMFAVRRLAEANGVAVTYANSVIWTAGAVSGARLTNAELGELAGRNG